MRAVVRREPVSALAKHPELDADPAYKQAEAYWDDERARSALPFYQSALTDREKVLRRTIRRRCGSGCGWRRGCSRPANYGRAIAWFELVTPQLVEVFGPNHELTRIGDRGASPAHG